MNRIHIIGKKNCGKTTLVVDLVRTLSQAGCRVATVKHTHHHHELDTPGKDSHRHREAGAVAVGILAPGMTAIFLPRETGTESSERYREILRMVEGCDLLLVEGDTRADGLKLEVWRAATNVEPFAAHDRSIQALITDDPVDVQVPVWPRSDVSDLANRLRDLAGI